MNKILFGFIIFKDFYQGFVYIKAAPNLHVWCFCCCFFFVCLLFVFVCFFLFFWGGDYQKHIVKPLKGHISLYYLARVSIEPVRLLQPPLLHKLLSCYCKLLYKKISFSHTSSLRYRFLYNSNSVCCWGWSHNRRYWQPPLKLGHIWVFKSHRKWLLNLLIHALIWAKFSLEKEALECLYECCLFVHSYGKHWGSYNIRLMGACGVNQLEAEWWRRFILYTEFLRICHDRTRGVWHDHGCHDCCWGED